MSSEEETHSLAERIRGYYVWKVEEIHKYGFFRELINEWKYEASELSNCLLAMGMLLSSTIGIMSYLSNHWDMERESQQMQASKNIWNKQAQQQWYEQKTDELNEKKKAADLDHNGSLNLYEMQLALYRMNVPCPSQEKDITELGVTKVFIPLTDVLAQEEGNDVITEEIDGKRYIPFNPKQYCRLPQYLDDFVSYELRYHESYYHQDYDVNTDTLSPHLVVKGKSLFLEF